MHDRHDPCSSHGTLMIHSSQLYSPSLGPNSCSWLPDHRNGIWVHNGTNFRRSKHPSTTGWRSQGSSSHHFGSAQKQVAELAKFAIPKTLQLDNQRGAPCQWVQEAEHALLYHVTMLPPCSPSSTMHPAKLIGNSCVHHVRNANSIVCPVDACLQLRAVPSPMLFGELAAHAPKTSWRLQNLQNLQVGCGCICPPKRPTSPAGGWRSPSGLLPPTSSPDQFATTNMRNV